jgi:hypothetical protein
MCYLLVEVGTSCLGETDDSKNGNNDCYHVYLAYARVN